MSIHAGSLLFSFLFIFGPLVNKAQSLSPVIPVYDPRIGVVKELRTKPAEVTGSIYLYNEWRTAHVILKKGVLSVSTLPNVKVRLDLRINSIELNTDVGVRILEGPKIDTLIVNDPLDRPEVFVNCANFNFEGTKLTGFCKVLASGSVALVERSYVEILKANYNVAMDIGNKDDQLIGKTKMYLIKNNELVTYSRKSFKKMVSDKEEYINALRNLNLNQTTGVIEALKIYNAM